jgi:hypothetical protein
MSGIFFDPNGVSMDRSFETNEFEQILNLLDTYNGDVLDNKIYNKFKEIFDKAKEQNDRNIHIVVTEPVEYDYDDLI